MKYYLRESKVTSKLVIVFDLVFMATPSSWILDRQDGLDRMSRTWPRWHCYRQGHLGSWCKNRRCSKVRSCECEVDGWFGCIVSQWLVHPVARLLVTPLSGFGDFIDCTKTNLGYQPGQPRALLIQLKLALYLDLQIRPYQFFLDLFTEFLKSYIYIYIISIYKARVSTFRTT